MRSLRQVGDLTQYQNFLRLLAARSAQLRRNYRFFHDCAGPRAGRELDRCDGAWEVATMTVQDHGNELAGTNKRRS